MNAYAASYPAPALNTVKPASRKGTAEPSMRAENVFGTLSLSTKTAAVPIRTAILSIETIGVSIRTAILSIEMFGVSIKTIGVSIRTAILSIEMFGVSIETIGVSVEAALQFYRSGRSSKTDTTPSMETRAPVWKKYLGPFGGDVESSVQR